MKELLNFFSTWQIVFFVFSVTIAVIKNPHKIASETAVITALINK